MRVLAIAVSLLCLTDPARAQQAESMASLQHLSIGLHNPPTPSILSTPVIGEPRRTKVGIFTFIPPSHRGEMVRVSLPVGDLVVRGVRGFNAMQHRRAERRAREEVQRVLREYEAQRRR